MEGLGRIYDIQGSFVADLDNDPVCEVSLRNAEGVTFLINAASAANAVNIDIFQTKDGANDEALPLPEIFKWFHKRHGSDIPGTWTQGANVAGDLLTGEVDNAFTSGNGGLVAFYIDASWLDVDRGFDTVLVQAVGTGARQGGIIAIVHPKVHRAPANMPSLLPSS